MPAPQIAVIGLPGLARALDAAGYDVLADGSTEPATVAAAVREAAAGGRPYVAVVGGSDPRIRQWVALQLKRNVAVLVVRSDVLGFEDPPPGSRTVDLPADLDTIMGRFGAPPRGAPNGTVVIGSDGNLVTDAPPSPVVEQHTQPPPSPFEAEPTPQQPTPQQPTPQGVATTEVASIDLRPPVPTERGWVAPVARSELLPDSFDPADLFRSQTSAPAPSARASRRAPVVITFSGKGGVGKTATALALAQRAATKGSLARVLLVDANRGQGDVRKYLRLRPGALASVYDAAASGDVRKAIVGPKRLAEHRDPSLAPLAFGVVLAPDDEHADPTTTPTAAYRSVVDFARERFDLVVLDTQIVEAADTSGLIDDLVVPLLLEGAYGVALADTSMAGVQNTLARVASLIARGASRDHLLLGVNRASPESGLDESLMRRRSEQLATWVGLVPTDPQVASAFERGFIPGDPDAPATPAYTAMLDAILARVTGLAAFDAHLADHSPAKRGGIFRRSRQRSGR